MKKILARWKRRRMDNIKINHTKLGCDSVKWAAVVDDRFQEHAFVMSIMNPGNFQRRIIIIIR
jgi:hypothetical protein